MRRLVCAVLLAALMLPGAAHAEEQPAILKAYDLDWIERVREEAWPQPKAQRPVICLLDTGVDVTPDTPADNPDGPIVARLALDGGTGLAQGTTWEHQHGTQMASIIAAPRNNYGTVGVFPQARIVSIRVTDKTQDEVYITPGAVLQGVRACTRWASAQQLRVASIVVAESNYDQRQVDVNIWAHAATQAATTGALIVAAAGNEKDADLVAPVAVPQILAVSAGDKVGEACAFVAEIEQFGAVRGPGCDANGWAPGSSSATAVVGSLAAVLATKLADRDGLVLRSMLLSATVPAAGAVGRVSGSSVRGLFEGAIEDLKSPAAEPSLPIVKSATLETPQPKTALWRPSIRVAWRRGRLYVQRVSGLAGTLNVRVVRRNAEVLRRAGRSFWLRAPTKPRAVEVWASSKDGTWRSLTSRCRVR